MKTDLARPLWFDIRVEQKPQIFDSRAELIDFETDDIEWEEAGLCARFEVLLAPWGDNRQVFSTALVRPLGQSALPYFVLGGPRGEGPRSWRGGKSFSDENFVRRHISRALPALLRRRLWGRTLWLDRELNLARTEDDAALLIYLGADGKGLWLLPGITRVYDACAGFDWECENPISLLLDSSDGELLDWVHARAEDLESDLAFSLNWVSWGCKRLRAARDKRAALSLRAQRGCIEELRQVLLLALQCEPEFAESSRIRWQIDPLATLDQAYGAAHQWQSPFNASDNASGDEHLSDGQNRRRLPPLTRSIRAWADRWFGVQIDRELLARHRCMVGAVVPLVLVVEREGAPSAHQQLEAFAQLRDFLAARVSPDELAALLKPSC